MAAAENRSSIHGKTSHVKACQADSLMYHLVVVQRQLT